MITYSIQHTKKRGDYIVNASWRPCVARFATKAEAAAFIAQKQAEDAADSERCRQLQARHGSFIREHPSLVDRQVRWQEWRNEKYSEMNRACRAAVYLEEKGVTGYMENPRYVEHKRARINEAAERAREISRVYGRAVGLDIKIKEAFWSFDAAAWDAALRVGEEFMETGQYELRKK